MESKSVIEAVLDELFIAPLKFAAEHRIQRAAQGQAVVEDAEALHAAQAFADQFVLAALGLICPLGVGQIAARDTHKVCKALFQKLLGQGTPQ